MLIRNATIKDASRLLEIYSYYVTNTAITFEYDVPSLEEFTQRIINTQTKYPYLVIEDEEERVIGYCYASPFKQRSAYNWAVETSIYIDKDNRKKGLGKTLYIALENALKKMNIVTMAACITFPDNDDEYLTKNSFYFHEKMGFSKVGMFNKIGYKFNRWYNIIWMEKQINERNENQDLVIPYNAL